MNKARFKAIVAGLAAVLLLLFASFLFMNTSAKQTFAAEQTGTLSSEPGALQSEIDEAQSSAVITLKEAAEESLTIPQGKTVTLDLSTYTLTGTLTNYGTLTVTAGEGGTLTSADGNITLVNYGVAKVVSGTVTGAGSNNYVIKNYGDLTLGEDAQSVVSVSSARMNASLIANGYSSDSDMTANASKVTSENKATLTINGGTYSGGMNAVKNDSDGVLIINDGTFTSGYVDSDKDAGGGSVILTGGKTTTINGGTFTQTAGKNYVLFVDVTTQDHAITISDGEFENAGNKYRSAIAFKNRSSSGKKFTATISGGTFEQKLEIGILGADNPNATDSITVTGGTFNSELALGNLMHVSLEGGTYKTVPAAHYFGAETKVYKWTAESGHTGYTLAASQPEGAEAINAVQITAGSYFNQSFNSLSDGFKELEKTTSSYYSVTITLYADITESLDYNFTRKTVTINLNGNSWMALGDKPALTIAAGSKAVTLKDSKSGGKIVGSSEESVIVNNGTLTLSSGNFTISNDAAGDYALIQNAGTFTISNYSANNRVLVCAGTAVLDNSGTATIGNGVTFGNGEYAAKDIVAKGGTVGVNGGSYKSTDANLVTDGGTILLGTTSISTMTGATLSQAVPETVTVSDACMLQQKDGGYQVVRIAATLAYNGAEYNYATWTEVLAAYNALSEKGVTEVTLTVISSKYGKNNCGDVLFTVPAGMTVTLNQNGMSVSGGVENNGTLILQGQLSGYFRDTVTNNGTLTIEGGAYEDTKFVNNGTLTIEGGVFTSIIFSGTNAPVITGGKFGGDNTSSTRGNTFRAILPYIAEGYVLGEMDKGITSNYAVVKQADAAATCTDGEYTFRFEKISDAAKYGQNHAASTSIKITLLQNVTDETLSLFRNYTKVTNWVVDLGGYTLTLNYNNKYTTYLSVIGESSKVVTVTIQNGSIAAAPGENAIKVANVFLIRNGSSLTLDNVNVTWQGAAAVPTPEYAIGWDGASGTLKVEGGAYTGLKALAESKVGCTVTVNGGSVVSMGNTYYTSMDAAIEAGAVAFIDKVAYATVNEAIAAAEAGDTIKLLASTEEDVVVTAGKSITLDLNGMTLTNVASHTIVVKEGAALTIEGEGTVDNVTHQKAALFSEKQSTVVLEGGKYTRSKEASTSKDAPNGNSYYNIESWGDLTIQSGVTVESTGAYSSLISTGEQDVVSDETNYNTVIINGGHFEGGVNTIKNNSSNLTINGGTFLNSTHATVLNWKDLTIKGGTFTPKGEGNYAVLTGEYEVGGQLNEATVNITNGTFEGYVLCVAGYVPQDPYNITGGTYSVDVPEQYIAEDSLLVPENNKFVVKDYATSVEEAVASETVAYVFGNKAYTTAAAALKDGAVAAIGKVAYASVNEAIEAAKANDTIKLLCNVALTEKIVVNKGVTLDLGGHTVTGPVQMSDISLIYVSAPGATIKNGTIASTASSTQGFVLGIFATTKGQLDLTDLKFDMQLGNTGNASVAAVFANGTQLVAENVTVDLTTQSNGYTFAIWGASANITLKNSSVTAENSIGKEVHAVHLQGGASATIEGGSISSSDTGVMIAGSYANGNDAIAVDKKALPSLNLTDVTVAAADIAVCGNEENHGTVINISGGTYKTTNEGGLAIYHPQFGYLTISGEASFEGETGIEMRAGNLTIEGDAVSVTATADFSEKADGSGNTFRGVAVGVSQHTTNLPISVTIEGGTFTATGANGKAFYEADLQDAVTEGVETALAGGTFEGEVASENVEGFITGGSYTVKPAVECVNEVYAMEEVNGVFVPSAEIKLAQLDAQAQVRSYAATQGVVWSELSAPASAATEAEALLAAFDAIMEANSRSAIAFARTAALDAVDTYVAAVAADLAAYKAEKIAEIQNAAAATTQLAEVVVPTATYYAINAATSKTEVDFYAENALKEINDIRAYRADIKTIIDDLEDDENGVLAKIDALNDALLDNTDGYLVSMKQDILDKIADVKKVVDEAATSAELETAQSAIESAIAATESNLKKYITDEVVELLNTKFETLNDTVAAVEEALADKTNGLEAIKTAVGNAKASADNAVTAIGNMNDRVTNEVLKAIEAAKTAASTAEKNIMDYLKGGFTTMLEGKFEALDDAVTDLSTLLNDGTNGLEAIKTLLTETKAEVDNLDTSGIAGLTEAVAGVKGVVDAIKTKLDTWTVDTTSTLNGLASDLQSANAALDQLTGALLNETKTALAPSITAAIANVASILEKVNALDGKLAAMDDLATTTDVTNAVSELAEQLSAIKTVVDTIKSGLTNSAVVEAEKEEAIADMEAWLINYVNSLVGNLVANDGVQVLRADALAYTPETEEGDVYAKLLEAYSEKNAKLILRYYNEALSAIDSALTVADVNTAVSTFRAQVASVEAAQGNSPDLTLVYILLGVVLGVLVIAFIAILVTGRKASKAASEAAEAAEDAAEASKDAAEASKSAADAASEAAEASKAIPVVTEVVKEEVKEEPVEEVVEEPAAEEAPAEEPEQPSEEEEDLGDKERVVIAANVRSFGEAYITLDEPSRELFNKVKDYALSKEGTNEVKLSSGICIKLGSKQVVKLSVRRGLPVALFILENEMLKDFRRNASSQAKLKVRATELVLREEEDLETAFTMVDLSIEQIGKDIEAAKERRREQRRARRQQKQLEAAAAEAEATEEEAQPTAPEAEEGEQEE